MWTNEHDRHVFASPASVWTQLADVEAWAEWNDGVDHIEVDGPVAPGTTFTMTPPGAEALRSTIVEFEPAQRFTDVTDVDGVSVRVEHLLEPQGDGTLVTYRIAVGGAAPDDVLAEIGSQASADFPDVLAALARRAERGAP